METVDLEIGELERKLKAKKEEKQELEGKRTTALKNIRKANEEFEADIDYLEEQLEKYQNKLNKNTGKQESLETEKLALEQKEKDVEAKLEEHKLKIEEITQKIEETEKGVYKRDKQKSSREKLTSYYEEKQEEFRSIITKIQKIDLKELEKEINLLEEGLDKSTAKLSTLDVTLEQLALDKKTLAQKKKFKDAKRVKETLELKQKDKEMTEKWIQEAKINKETAEENMIKTKKTLRRLAEKRKQEEAELREYEYKILRMKKKELKESLEEAEGVIGYEDIFKIMDKEIRELEVRYGFCEDEESEEEVKSGNG